MIKNKEILQKFEIENIQKTRISYEQSLKIYEAMYREYIHMCGNKNQLSSLDKDIKIAKVLNKCLNK